MKAFLIADPILFGPASRWLHARTSQFVLKSEHNGVWIFVTKGATVTLVRPDNFSFAALSEALESAMTRADELLVVAPSMIQYFASKMTNKRPIFDGINVLSQYAVSVVQAPVFRMLDAPGDGRTAVFKHTVMYASFPRDLKKADCGYIDGNGKLFDVSQLPLPEPVQPVSTPLIFFHSGLVHQQFDPDSLLKFDNAEDFGYERRALDQLMVRFPSRERPSTPELKKLFDRFGLEEQEVQDIWKHNRAEWLKVLDKLKVIEMPMPRPVENPDLPEFSQFSHLIMSGFLRLASSLDVTIPRIRHLGLPLFARNGVTIPLGPSGIVKTGNYSAATLDNRVTKLLGNVLRAKFVDKTRPQASAAIVENA